MAILNPIYCEAEGWRRAGENAWMLDKLMLSRALGYLCGPAGVPVPKPGTYIVRPCVNALGMGRGASFMRLEESTEHLPLGTFWCEVFAGRHLSVDYLDGEQLMTVEGLPGYCGRLNRWAQWFQVDDVVPLPDIFSGIDGPLNVEYIGGRVIEVHFRHNPDFRHGNQAAWPAYADDTDFVRKGFEIAGAEYVHDADDEREGFWII